MSREERLAVILGMAAMVMFSVNFAATRLGLQQGLLLTDLVAIRYLVAGLLFLPVLLRLGFGGLSPGRVAVLTLLGGVPYYLATAGGLLFAPASHGAILNPGGVVVTAPFLGWWLLGERPGRGVLLGLPLLLAGLLLVGGAGLMQGERGAWIGDLLLFGSGVQWALYGVALRAWKVGGLRGAAIVIVCSLPWVPLQLAWLGLGGIPAHPGPAALQVVVQGMMAGGLAVAFYSITYARLGPGRAAMFPPMVPALGTLWAAWLIAEPITPVQVAGAGLVILGMLVGVLGRR